MQNQIEIKIKTGQYKNHSLLFPHKQQGWKIKFMTTEPKQAEKKKRKKMVRRILFISSK